MSLRAASSIPQVVVLPGNYTVDTLPAPGAQYLDMYARVTDLFGEKRALVLCSQAVGTYFWEPVRPTYAKTITADQTLTLTPLKTPSVLFLTGTLTATRNYTLDTTNVYPGASFEIAFGGTLGIFGLNLLGAVGGTLAMVLGGRIRVFYDSTVSAWKQFQ